MLMMKRSSSSGTVLRTSWGRTGRGHTVLACTSRRRSLLHHPSSVTSSVAARDTLRLSAPDRRAVEVPPAPFSERKKEPAAGEV